MNVHETTAIQGNHCIEWGDSTWDENEKSIRNRYNTATGQFNYRGSGEIPWDDFKMMIQESIKRGKFTNVELSDILNEISNHLKTI